MSYRDAKIPICLPSVEAGSPAEAQVGVRAAWPIDSTELHKQHCFLPVVRHEKCGNHASVVQCLEMCSLGHGNHGPDP